ncbi:MAG: TIGR02221 family CRISPR-associated protein [Spirochaetota bacterium]
MGKKFISFLGTNNYLPCNYVFKEKSANNVQFVQDALISMFCANWKKEDQIIIFITQRARQNNWERSFVYEDNEQKPGLKEVLATKYPSLQVCDVAIPDGTNEEQIWKIFSTIINTIQNEDEILVDVTHAFRAIPMLAIVMINYLQIVRRVKFKGLYYGAIESLGTIADVAKMELKERNAPVIDLSSFVKLLEWTNAIHDFVVNGKSTILTKLVNDAIKPVRIETKGKDKIVTDISNVIEKIDAMTKNLEYCRGKNIFEFNYNELYKKIDELAKTNITIASIEPLALLFDLLLQKMELFKNYEDIVDAKKGIAASMWCMEHGLIQQSITILQESLISIILIKNKLDYTNYDFREMVSTAFYIKRRNLDEDKWDKKAKENKEIVNKLLNDTILISLLNQYDSLTQLRNDVNHCGFRENAANIRTIKNNITKILEDINQAIVQLCFP